jgi:hypothetical protein
VRVTCSSSSSVRWSATGGGDGEGVKLAEGVEGDTEMNVGLPGAAIECTAGRPINETETSVGLLPSRGAMSSSRP